MEFQPREPSILVEILRPQSPLSTYKATAWTHALSVSAHLVSSWQRLSCQNILLLRVFINSCLLLVKRKSLLSIWHKYEPLQHQYSKSAYTVFLHKVIIQDESYSDSCMPTMLDMSEYYTISLLLALWMWLHACAITITMDTLHHASVLCCIIQYVKYSYYSGCTFKFMNDD